MRLNKPFLRKNMNTRDKKKKSVPQEAETAPLAEIENPTPAAEDKPQEIAEEISTLADAANVEENAEEITAEYAAESTAPVVQKPRGDKVLTKAQRRKKTAIRWILMNVGIILMSLSVYFFQMPYNFVLGGVGGASLNTPSSLNSSFSIIGALILGDFAVEAGWFNPEIILYMAFVALANFTQPSYELGYGVKFMRVMLLILIAISPQFGFWIGLAIMILILYNAKTVSRQSYLYPLIPFNWSDFKMIFVRKKLHDKS